MKLTTRQRVRGINAAIRYGKASAYLRPPGWRLRRAYGQRGALRVVTLQGRHVTTTTSQRIEIVQPDGRILALYHGGPQ